MKAVVLADNRSGVYACGTEHGLSLYLETSRHKLLLDTGASDLFVKNAEKLGVDLKEVDFLFISHGHKDHSGGIRSFLEINSKAEIIMSSDIIDDKYYSMRGGLHEITADIPYEEYKDRFILVSKDCLIDRDIRVVVTINNSFPRPKGNENLLIRSALGDLVKDSFKHEMLLYTEGLLFTGCCHGGLLNILDAAPKGLENVIGGFHLLDGDADNKYESDFEILDIASYIMQHYPSVRLFTGHCTGDGVLDVMRQKLPALEQFAVGETIRF